VFGDVCARGGFSWTAASIPFAPAAMTYSGPTAVNAGKFVASTMETGGGAVTVSDGATFGVDRDSDYLDHTSLITSLVIYKAKFSHAKSHLVVAVDFRRPNAWPWCRFALISWLRLRERRFPGTQWGR
jgi:hypothetical protein